MTEHSIADSSKPNPGRIYDYVLGGGHNFEVDRIAAEELLKRLPFISKYARLQRWSLRNIAEELSMKRGFDVIIDFASGLPTNDHIHFRVPKGTTVIYSDIDRVTVEYAQEILEGTSNAWVFKSDAGTPDELLNNPEVERILNGRRKVAFVYWGVSGFLSDDAIKNAARVLYDWAAPGSCIAFNSQTSDVNHPVKDEVTEIYRKMGTKTYGRLAEECLALLEPWQVDGDGFVSLLEWHGFKESGFADDPDNSFGSNLGGHGAYFIKPA